MLSPDCHLAHSRLFIYFILLGFLVTSAVRSTDRTTKPDSKSVRNLKIRKSEIKKSEIWNSEIPKSKFRKSEIRKSDLFKKFISSSSPSQCVQALQPWASTWIVQLRSPCAPHTLIWSNGFWICLYTLGSWLVLPMWDISYFWFSFLPKLPTHITYNRTSGFRIFEFTSSCHFHILFYLDH